MLVEQEEVKVPPKSEIFMSPKLGRRMSITDEREYQQDEDEGKGTFNYKKESPDSKKKFVTYENERIWLTTWTSKLLPGGRKLYYKFRFRAISVE